MLTKDEIEFKKASYFITANQLAPGDVFVGIDQDNNPAFFEVRYAHPDGRVKISDYQFITGHLFQVVGRRKKDE